MTRCFPKATIVPALVFLGAISQAAAAEDSGVTLLMPDSAFYGGLGAAINSTNFNGWDVDATGISDVYENGVLVSSGSAGGPPVDLDLDSDTSFTPQIQLGYFNHFDNSEWLWGAKLAYNYLDSSSTREDFLIPQFGSYGATPFTGNAIVQSMNVSIENQFSFMPYLGHGFQKGFFYAGAGPTLSLMKTDITNLIGFADVQGQPTDIFRQPAGFLQLGLGLGRCSDVRHDLLRGPLLVC